jgi:hypothetical protein
MPGIARLPKTVRDASGSRAAGRTTKSITTGTVAQFLHVAVAQRKAEIEPDRVLDDLGRKTMAAIAERSHAATLTLRAALARPVNVTTPAALFEALRHADFRCFLDDNDATPGKPLTDQL